MLDALSHLFSVEIVRSATRCSPILGESSGSKSRVLRIIFAVLRIAFFFFAMKGSSKIPKNERAHVQRNQLIFSNALLQFV